MIWKLQRVGGGVCVGAWVVSERGGGVRGGGGKKARRRGVATGRLLLPPLPMLRFLPNLSRAKPLRHSSSLSLVLRGCVLGGCGGWVAWRQEDGDVSVPRRPAHLAAVRTLFPTHHSRVDASAHSCLRADGASCWQTRGRYRRERRLRDGRNLLSVYKHSVD